MGRENQWENNSYFLSKAQIAHQCFFRKLPTEEMLLWQPLMEELLHCCLAISDIVSPVVQNSSPEGNVPEEAIKGKFFSMKWRSHHILNTCTNVYNYVKAG